MRKTPKHPVAAKGKTTRRKTARRRDGKSPPGRPAQSGREPLDWRRQHDPLGEGRPAVERHGLRIADAEGTVSYPHRVFDTLAALHRNGSIDDREYAAARQFQDDWGRAALDPLKVPSLDRALGQSGGGAHLTEVALRAREAVWRALQGLGGHTSPIGQAAWYVVGWGMTVKEFASRTQLGGGRALDEKTARGLVVGACGVLAGWYERKPRR